MTKQKDVAPRSLQEWMEREGCTAERLLQMVRRKTGRDISRTMFSFILRGSRRCSLQNALALHAVTGVPIDTLTEWPRVSYMAKLSGGRSKKIA